ncbi:MAG: glycosyltransferase family 39 protein [Patescibacteria group bacterium]
MLPSPSWKGREVPLLLAGLCVLLAFLVLPGFRYPLVSDSAIYALTGESVWKTGTYALFGVPYATHLPLHAILSYPFAAVLGYGAGMKTAALFMGWGGLLATYALLAKPFGRTTALAASAFLTLHHGFVYEIMVASSDITFLFLFLLSLAAFQRAAADARLYLAAGLLAGLASLTRYNGAPLFPLFLFVILFRGRHRRSPWFWWGMAAGGFLFSLWFLRNALTFGNPLHSGYFALWPADDPLGARLVTNALYYANPLHNILFLFPFALLGLWKEGRKQWFLVFSMLAGWALTSFWWTLGTRFALPGYPILFGFAAFGLIIAARALRPEFLRIPFVAVIVCGQLLGLGVYAYGSFNAWFDRTIGLIPPDLHLTTEGFHAWDLARNELNRIAEPGSRVLVQPDLHAATWRTGVFRPDMRVTSDAGASCPLYAITPSPPAGAAILFRTDAVPVTFLARLPCVPPLPTD